MLMPLFWWPCGTMRVVSLRILLMIWWSQTCGNVIVYLIDAPDSKPQSGYKILEPYENYYMMFMSGDLNYFDVARWNEYLHENWVNWWNSMYHTSFTGCGNNVSWDWIIWIIVLFLSFQKHIKFNHGVRLLFKIGEVLPLCIQPSILGKWCNLKALKSHASTRL